MKGTKKKNPNAIYFISKIILQNSIIKHWDAYKEVLKMISLRLRLSLSLSQIPTKLILQLQLVLIAMIRGEDNKSLPKLRLKYRTTSQTS